MSKPAGPTGAAPTRHVQTAAMLIASYSRRFNANNCSQICETAMLRCGNGFG
jgi:hypothetical protein